MKRNKYSRDKRRIHLQSVMDTVIHYVRIEIPDIKVEVAYNNKKTLSHYICFMYDPIQYVVRVSDHHSARRGFDFNIVVKYDEPFKLCTTVSFIVYNIRKLIKKEGEHNEQTNNNNS